MSFGEWADYFLIVHWICLRRGRLFSCKQLNLLHLIPSQNATNYLLVAPVLRLTFCHFVVIYWFPKYVICKAFLCVTCSCSCGSFLHWYSLVCCCWATFCVSLTMGSFLLWQTLKCDAFWNTTFPSLFLFPSILNPVLLIIWKVSGMYSPSCHSLTRTYFPKWKLCFFALCFTS